MKPLRVALATLCAALPIGWAAIANAQAETEQQVQERLSKPNYGLGGYYLGFEGLVAIENSKIIAPDAVLVSGGLDIRLGNRHNRWFATELYGLYVHTYADGTGQFLAWGMSINEHFYFTNKRVQPFVNVGLGFLQVRSRNFVVNPFSGSQGFNPGFAPIFGIGLEIYANENVAFTIMANYHLTVGNISGFDFVTTGIGMQFF